MKRYLKQKYLCQDSVIATRPRLDVSVCKDVAAYIESPPPSPPPCDTLIDDCWEHIFDYLPIRDVYSMAQTCKRMNRFAGYYFHKYSPELEYTMEKDGIYCSSLRWYNLESNFHEFVTRLRIDQKSYLNSVSQAQAFSSLKTLIFNNIELTSVQINSRRTLLRNVENLHINGNTISDAIFTAISNYCPKLKCLDIRYTPTSFGVDNNIFLQHYPNLEHLRYEQREDTKIDAMGTFLKKHPNLKQITTNFRFLRTHRDIFSTTNIELDILTVEVPIDFTFNEFVELLKQLYERGFYKLLSVTLYCWEDKYKKLGNKIAALPGLHKLTTHKVLEFSDLALANLKEWHLWEFDMSAEDVENLAKNVVNLEKFTLDYPKIEHILSFVRHSKKLKKLIANYIALPNCVLDLMTYNQERMKLAGACKLTIHVLDRAYIPTKWKYQEMNLTHVKVVRS